MKAEALRSYLQAPRELIHAELLVSSIASDEVVEFEVNVDLPQRPLYPILDIEPIYVRLPRQGPPEIHLTRKDFPLVPHLVQEATELSRQLCLYERPWSEEESNWSPSSFVDRIRKWLSGTADGSLHRVDQPLEPMLLASPYKVVLPWCQSPTDRICWVERFYVSVRGDKQASLTFLCFQKPPQSEKALYLPVIFIQGPKSIHGIIHRTPASLKDLELLLQELGGSIIEAISSQLAPLIADLKDTKLAEAHLILVLRLPKQREENGKIETYEHQAFFLEMTLGELLRVDTSYAQEGSLFVPRKVEQIRDLNKLGEIHLVSMSVRWWLTPVAAAAMNGLPLSELKAVVIGAGALGSQIMNNLSRRGFGKWTIVDHDDFEPHNAARHLLPSSAVGLKKASLLADHMRQVFITEDPPLALPSNYLFPKDNDTSLTSAIHNADFILDCSASIAVQRELARDPRSNARRISVFLNQRGDELVLFAEDRDRILDLIWIEAEYYRAVGFDRRLEGHFDYARLVAHRYGNACRELSATFRQDHVAIHAGLAANQIPKCLQHPDARSTVFRLDHETSAVSVVEIPLSRPLRATIEDWSILIHPDVTVQMSQLRLGKLPSETGGVLLGLVDRKRQFIAIVSLLPAPPDSIAWPTSFIRGSAGLVQDVQALGEKTLGNIVYVGEWHSHPPGHDATPSNVDWEAISLCAPFLEADGLPTMMLIAGEEETLCIAAKPLRKNVKWETRLK